jgi:hypothetical protein
MCDVYCEAARGRAAAVGLSHQHNSFLHFSPVAVARSAA